MIMKLQSLSASLSRIILLYFSPAALWAQDAPAEIASDAAGMSDIDKLTQAVKDLQNQVAAQDKKIKDLEAKYQAEVSAEKKEVENRQKVVKQQEEKIDTQRQAMQSLQQQVDTMAQQDPNALTDEEKKFRARLETVESSIDASQKAEGTAYDSTQFPGSIPIPGSSAAIKIGGFVKMAIVESFDPIGTEDRFIVGTIPVPKKSGPTTAALSVNQTRLNFDLRDTTEAGPLRAFIEGDFNGGDSVESDSDEFRLRHAFGQWKDLLIGKTWSTFMDFDAIPEDIDFEGINGQINLRQPQIRYFPSFGISEDWNLLIALEDPDPNIEGGEGISNIPDVVLSVRREWFKRWHIKSALLYRSIEADCNENDGAGTVLDPINGCATTVRDTDDGWALTFSGKTAFKVWDKRDNFLFQFNYGEGFSTYINDLSSIGEADAVFNFATGELEALQATSYYIAFQKWWAPTFRSNFNYSFVSVDNADFQPDEAYKKTRRATANVIWSPTPRVDFGAEFLYGYRENKNSENANAAQLQLSGTYRY
jgi:flagellar motor protein MotB